MTNKELRKKIRDIRDSLSPKNKECHGFLNKEVDILSSLLIRLDKEQVHE